MKKRFFKENIFLNSLRAKFFALICVLLLGVGNVNAEYWQLRVKAILPDGSPANSLVSAYGYNQSAVTPTLSDYTMPAPDNSWYSSGPDAYLKSIEAEGESFVGWYSDEACTNLLSSTANVELWGSSYWGTSVATAAAPEDVAITPIYAKFIKPKRDWSLAGTAPTAGNYYIFNLGYNGFLTKNGTSLRGTKDDSQALLLTLTSGETTTLSCVVDEKTLFVNQNGGGLEETETPHSVTLEPQDGGNYMVHLDRTSYTHWDMYTSGSMDYNNKDESKLTQRWIFISEEEYNNPGHVLYYAAQSESTKGGSVKVAFENPVPEGATNIANDQTASTFAHAVPVTAYFKAIPEEGYEFVGWKKSPAGGYLSFDVNYSETFDATSTSETSPTTLTMYAYFEKESEDEVELFDTNGSSNAGSFAEMYAAAGNGYSIVLHKNIDLGSTPLTINKNITIDFNNRAFTGTVSNLVTIASGKTVTFADNSSEAAGGVRVSANTNAEINAVQVNGTLKFYGGVIKSENTSEESEAKATALTVASSGALELKGGKIDAKANSNAYGVKNEGVATLTMGSINATATTNAYGVIANGTTNITWSVAVNATTTSGDNAIGVLVDYSTAKATIDGGVITATSAAANAYGIWAKSASEAVKIGGNMAVSVNAGTTTTAYAIKENGVAVNVETGRFASNNTQDVIAATAANLKLYGGYYVHEAGLATYKQAGVTKGTLQDGTKFYTEGYRYILSNGDNPNYVVAVAFGEGFSKKFGSLEDAILYANNNPDTEMTIRLEVTDYTLPTGNYTIPAKATLLIPYMVGQTVQESIERTFNIDYVKPSQFAKLTLESGVHMDVLGTIEIGCKQSAKGQNDAANGAPTGPYGWLYLSSECEIVVADGGTVRAWGFVTGDGTIDVRRGASIWEQFQILDFKGGSITTALINDRAGKGHRLFPMSQYFIQNIESKTTYHPGSKLTTMSAFYMSASVAFDSIQIIGVYNRIDGEEDDVAMFLMDDADNSDDTWVRKYYDVATDYQMYEVNSSAKLGSMIISSASADMDSRDFDLPITNNMHVRLLSGSMEITQRMVMLPGAQITIDKQSTVFIPDDPSKNYDGALFLYDAAEWGTYVYSGYYAQRVKYTPTIDGAPTARSWGRSKTVKPGSAAINVKGTLDITGALYTTSTGANIFSDNDNAGTIRFNVDAAADGSLTHIGNTTTTGLFTKHLKNDQPMDACPSAKLKNGNGTYVATKDVAKAGDTYCYMDGAWKNLEEEGCFVIDKTNPENWKYLAKPQGYVELLSNEEDPETHLYYSKEGGKASGRKFILIGDCEWWEVEDVEENDALVHCTHPNNDKYYYYDDEVFDTWMEKEFTITWVTKPYEELEENQGRVVYNVDYKSMPKYLGTNPSRPMNAYYTYDFTGWLPALAPVTDDAIYVAQFQQNDRKYMITFLDEDGSVLEEALWKMGDIPAPVNAPTPSGKKLVWEPLITAVNGDATYRATYTDIVLPAYEITFVNWDGTELQKGNVNTNTIPEYTGSTPTKAPIADVAFEFEGWTPDLAPVDGEAVYTAKFREKPATYTITFLDATGEGDPVQIGEALTLGYGETPVCSTPPTKAPTAEFYYTVIWSPLISAVTGNATYTATGFAAHKNTCRLTVSAGANGKVSLDGSEEVLSAVYEYGDPATILATPTATGYHFVRWSDGNTTNPRTVTVNAAISLTAEFALNQYEITWKKDADTEIETTMVNHGVVPSHVAPTKATDASNTYSFAGWSPVPAAATANATYTATFNATPIEYTVRFILNNGLSDVVYEGLHYGDPISIGTPVKASQNGVNYTFQHWTNAAGDVVDEIPGTVTQNEIYTAQYEARSNNLIAGNSDDANAKDILINAAGMEAHTLTIEKDGSVNIKAGASLTVQRFILESTGDKSGQLIGLNGNLTVEDELFFDFIPNGEAGTQARTWYAVAVPWEVNAENGIFWKEGNRQLIIGRDFDLIYYDVAKRAAEGDSPACWKYVQHDGDKTMHPGQMYMMYFDPGWKTIRFKANNNATALTMAEPSVTTHSAATGNDKDANWNGIANPAVYHAYLDAGATYGQVLSNGNLDNYLNHEGSPVYSTVMLSSYKFVVGKPVYVQAETPTEVDIRAATPSLAPRRVRAAGVPEGIEAVYQLTVAAEGHPSTDNLFIQTAEEKEAVYVIGKDLAKGGVAKNNAQLWINRYGVKLSVNTTAPVNGVHEYPLGLSIPAAGEYTIAIESAQGDTEDLYLTRNGEAIWNLSEGAYTANLEKGTHTNYGLRVSARAPQIATGIDEAVVDAKGETRKVLINDQVFIIRGENVYSTDGQLVK